MNDNYRLADAPAYRLAFEDLEFLSRPEVRSYRLALEYVKPQLAQRDMSIDATVVVFGSARIPSAQDSKRSIEAAKSAVDKDPADEAAQARLLGAQRLDRLVPYYEEARRFAAQAGRYQKPGHPYHFVVTTGGGPGIMEAANRGAFETGLKSMAFNIELPHEQEPNPYITPALCFNFQYFAIRKMHFLLRARALAFFPGGFGTMDELFESLTLMQTGKIDRMPVVLFGRSWWEKFMNLDALVEAATISPQDAELIAWADTAEQGWAAIEAFYEGGVGG